MSEIEDPQKRMYFQTVPASLARECVGCRGEYRQFMIDETSGITQIYCWECFQERFHLLCGENTEEG